MIGKICTILSPFYDSKNQKKAFKKRPALVIVGPRNNDYIILPVSSVSKKENLDNEYDIKIDPEKYPDLKLKKVSYIRTHKQTIVHRAEILGTISSLKEDYKDLYEKVIETWSEFQYEVLNESLK